MKTTLTKPIAALAAAVALLAPLAASAATYTVPDHFSTIQEAVNAAANGDVIYVRPGIYYENVSIENKSLKLQSLKGAAQTIIDGRRLGATITVARSSQVDVDGFTIQNGAGAGVWYRLPSGSWPSGTVSNSVIVNNDSGVSSDGGGGGGHPHLTVRGSVIASNANSGVYVHMACAYVFDSVIANNHAANGGGVFIFHDAYVNVSNSFITGNHADGSGGGIEVTSAYGSSSVSNSVIDQNTAGVSGGGIHVNAYNSYLTIQSTTVAGNTAPVGAGISHASANAPFRSVNSIIWGNSTLPDIQYPASVSFTTSDVEGGIQPGTGNISADPLFASAAGRNYQLFAGSPAIDTGSAVGGTDLLGVPRPKGAGDDIGAYEWTESIAPVSTAAVTGTVGANGIYTSSPTVTITAEDLYGVSEIHYIVNGAETVVSGPTATFTLSSDGNYDLSWWAVDKYGNVEATKVLPTFSVDATAPFFVSSSPANGATNVVRGATVVITFSEAVGQGSAFDGVTLNHETTVVAVTKTLSGNQLTLQPSSALSTNAVYTVTVPAGAVVDAAGTPTAAATTFSFATVVK